jgi:hypothetical protein
MKKDNKIDFKGFLNELLVISYIIVLISIISKLDFLIKWTIIGTMIITGSWYIFLIFKKIKSTVDLIESNRIDNKRGLIIQYFFIVPKGIFLFVLITIPLDIIFLLFYYVGFETSIYRTYCLPLLGGFIGETIWFILYSSSFYYSLYSTYKYLYYMYPDLLEY